jgi:2-polyprenyl-3-methyl-5-hydroxy-6-metoxy-1,4-benzoquinol methylase
MTLRDILLNNSSFIFEKDIFYQKELLKKNLFEKMYIDLRKRENRVYSDQAVQYLPEFEGPRDLKKEWAIRKITLKKLIKYFDKKKCKLLILELGCGNGWLSHQLASSLNTEFLGLDVNETELLQGASLFKNHQNLSFMCADVFTAELAKSTFDIILLASSIQYFSNLKQLMHRLEELLKPSGEIHIADSPLYNSLVEIQEAQKRSHEYFNSQSVPEMANNYFHHSLSELKSFNHRILFKPNSLISIFKRKILRIPESIFPWIVIKRL